MNKEKHYELSQVINAKKIVDSMAFKTSISIVQLFIVLSISVLFAQVSLGFENFSNLLTTDYWANVLILFGEQYWIYYIIYDWFFMALSKSDERLVGNDDILGLNKEIETYIDNLNDEDKVELGLKAWNKKQKFETYKLNVKEHITDLQNKLEKARLKNNEKKIEKLKNRLETAKTLYTDPEIIDEIEFVNVKNYKNLSYKDLMSDGSYSYNQKGYNTLIDLKGIRFKRFLSKGLLKLLVSMIGGLLAYRFIVGGEGFWQRLAYMVSIMGIQVIWAIKDAYTDNNIHIINRSLIKKALGFITTFKIPKTNEKESTLN